MNYNTPGYFLLLFCTLLWCALILLPLVASFTSPVSHSVIAFFSLICHQFDSHTIHVNGHAMAVCTRCFAIYFGFLFAVIVLPFLRAREIEQQKMWWVIALMPMLADVILHLTGINSSSSFTRLLSGGFFGMIAGRIVIPLVISMLINNNRKYTYSLQRGSQ